MPAGGDREDGALLSEYARSGSAGAVDELFRRHGQMVHGVCLRACGNAADAEDATQAVFLALIRKAGSLGGRSDISGWLHWAAVNAGRKAVRSGARRAKREREAGEMKARLTSPRKDVPFPEEVSPRLDEAIARLPGRQRQVVVRQYLEGRSQSQIAEEMGISRGAVARQSCLGIEKLRRGLRRSGKRLSGALIVSGLEAARGQARAAMPAALAGKVSALAAGGAAAASVEAIAKGVLMAMFWAKCKLFVAASVAATALLVAGGAAVMAGSGGGKPPEKEKPSAPTKAVAPAGSNFSARSEALRAKFAKLYKPVKVKLKPAKVPQLPLPLDTSKIANWETIEKLYFAGAESETALKLLRANAFAVTGFSGDEVGRFYHDLKIRGVPIFVTSDSLLHLYHIQFDETLKEIEEKEFFNDALGLAKALYEASLKQHGRFEGVLKEAARRNAAYFAVALECLASDRTREELRKARDEVTKWPERDWRKIRGFSKQYPIAFAAAKARTKRPWELQSKKGLLKHLEAALAAAPAGKKETEYALAENIKSEVAAELALIEKHGGFEPSPIFKYKEDYSQYVPRGHYTRSEKLKRYFKALMWFGRLTFLIKSKSDPGGGLVEQEDARLQTVGALLATDLLRTVKLADGRGAAEVWDRMYSVTAYYVGFADDLTPYEYADSAAKVLGQRYDPAVLAADAKYRALKLELARLRPPEIYSGTGDIMGPPPASAGEEDLLKALEKTKGFRLMGQRYIPDSFMMGRLVYPTVAPWGGGEFAFTTVMTRGGPARCFPRGLDVMAVLGSERAGEIIKRLRDDNYPKTAKAKSYDQVIAGLREQFSGIDEAGWNRNMYWSWLYCLKALIEPTPTGSSAGDWPTFTRTPAWHDKQINAALASWSQLRHDTILYAKQSYTMKAGGRPPQPKMVEGYVEPVPEFYARLLALTRMTKDGLASMKVLSEAAGKRLEALDSALVRLLDISVRELQNEKLAESDYTFIRGFALKVKAATAGVSDAGLETTIVADVHTDGNSRQVLEEGTGYLRNMVVVYPMPDGNVVAGAGPVLSYYEFKHPMRDRLTDEKWKAMLRGAGKPALPEWTDSFATKGAAAGRVRPTLKGKLR